MINFRTCRKHFLLGLGCSVAMLIASALLMRVSKENPNLWRSTWIWSLASLVMLMPVFRNPGRSMAFAILQSMNRWRAWATIGVFGVACLVLYYSFTKAIAIVIAGLFLIFGVLAVTAYFICRAKLRPDQEKMGFVVTFFATALYLGMVAITFCSVFIGAVETAKIAAQVPAPLDMTVKVGSQRVGELWDARGEIHVHSRLSHDSRGTFKEIAAAANKNGIRWILLTDHISALPEGDFQKEVDGVLFIYGEEKGFGYKRDGREVRNKSAEFNAPIDGTRRLHMIGHLNWWEEWGPDQWDALELANFHANGLDKKWAIIGKIFTNPGAIYDEFDYVDANSFRLWQELAVREKRPMPIFGGPDAHQNVGMFGTQADPYELMLHKLSTHIWLEKDVAVSEKAVLEAIKKGRTYVAFEAQGDPIGFQFWAENEQYQFFTGDTVRAPKRLIVKPPLTKDCEVRIYQDNKLMATRKECAFAWCDLGVDNPVSGFWRAEVWRFGKPWIISGQILVQ